MVMWHRIKSFMETQEQTVNGGVYEIQMPYPNYQLLLSSFLWTRTTCAAVQSNGDDTELEYALQIS